MTGPQPPQGQPGPGQPPGPPPRQAPPAGPPLPPAGAAPSGPQQGPAAWNAPSGAQPPLAPPAGQAAASPPPTAPFPPQQPTEQPLQGTVLPPGGKAPGAEDATQVVPPVADDATQVVPPVDAAATQAMPPAGAAPSAGRDDIFGGRPMFRDEVAASEPAASTAEMDLSEYDDYVDSQRRRFPARPLLIGAGFVALLLVAGGGAFLLASGGGGSESAAPSPEGGYDVSLVSDESTDPEPLKAGELFAEETVDIDGETFSLLLTDDTDRCDTTAHGDYAAVLTEHDCRQVVRATYANKDGTRAVTVGVAAMANSDGAQAAAEAQDPANTLWFAGLAGQEGSGAERMDIAGGHVASAVWGRYVVFSLAANADGRTPENEDPELEKISAHFIDLALAPLGERAVQ